MTRPPPLSLNRLFKSVMTVISVLMMAPLLDNPLSLVLQDNGERSIITSMRTVIVTVMTSSSMPVRIAS